jgi:NitT/TauT family transport system ATP-binding protein
MLKKPSTRSNKRLATVAGMSATVAEAVAAPLVVSGLQKRFGDDAAAELIEVIADISFTLARSEIVSIVGPSGCGKSTLLNLLCGLTPPTDGMVRWFGREAISMPQGVGYMLQKDLLLPWRTALHNVTLGMEIRGITRAERHPRAQALLNKLGLKGFHGHYPATLSGGMRQRIALARTLVNDPEVLLLDEPFAALDFQTKLVLESDMARLVRSEQRSVLMITHDVDEAVSLSDRVIVLSQRPARIRSVHKIDISGDRTDMMEARDSPRFNQHVRAILAELELGSEM